MPLSDDPGNRSLDVVGTAARLETELRAVARPERAAQEKAYLKSDLEHLGASVPAVRAVVTALHREQPGLGHDDVVDLAAALWAVPVHERRAAAVELLDLYGAVLSAADAPLLERLLRESRGWALLDGLAASVVGPLVEREPDAWAPVLDRWAADDDFWLRRASMLALLLALRRGEGDWARFAAYADAMLDEREFFIRKAIGWVLRDTARRRPGLVAGWLAPRAGRCSGVTIREAVKPLAPDVSAALLAAYREKRPVDPATQQRWATAGG